MVAVAIFASSRNIWPGHALCRSVCLEEGLNLANGQRNAFFGFFPGKHTDFRSGGEQCSFHGDSIGMCGNIVRQNQHWSLAIPNKITCHREDEVRSIEEHLACKPVDHFGCDGAVMLHQIWSPSALRAVVHVGRMFGAKADRLCEDTRDDAVRRALDEVPDKRTADAEPKHKKLVDTQVVHQIKLIVGVRIPWAVELERS